MSPSLKADKLCAAFEKSLTLSSSLGVKSNSGRTSEESSNSRSVSPVGDRKSRHEWLCSKSVKKKRSHSLAVSDAVNHLENFNRPEPGRSMNTLVVRHKNSSSKTDILSNSKGHNYYRAPPFTKSILAGNLEVLDGLRPMALDGTPVSARKDSLKILSHEHLFKNPRKDSIPEVLNESMYSYEHESSPNT